MAMRPEDVDYKFFRLFRILFGLCLADSALEDFVAGFHQYALLEPKFHFHYDGLGWLQPLPEPFFSGCYVLLICSALLFSAGFFWRFTSVLNLVLYSYIHFIEKADYNNHYYLVVVLCFFFCLREVPKGESRGPAWYLDLFRYQFAFVYFFAGLAKWNRDWLLGEPLGHWMGPISSYYGAPWLAGSYFVGFMAMGGLLVDLLAGPALLHLRTRYLAVIVLLGFHSFNEALFQIGVFPAMMVSSCLLFLGPPVHSREVWQGKTAHFMIVFLLFQLLMPLRHYIIPGLSLWTEDGHRYSWRMKLRSKRAHLRELIVNGKPVNALNYLTQTQIRRMASRPDMICEFADYLREQHSATSVRMLITARLNGRPMQIFVSPNTELLEVDVSAFKKTTWVKPLEYEYLPKDPKYTRRALVAFLYAVSIFQFVLGLLSNNRRERWPWTLGQFVLSLAAIRLFFHPTLPIVVLLAIGTAGLWSWTFRTGKADSDMKIFLVFETVVAIVLGSLVGVYG